LTTQNGATINGLSSRTYDDGAIMEIRVWKVPQAVPGSTHALKYRLFYGYPGRRLIG